ncbi:hypothetical protein LCGC14_1079610 [marine sediment metagenome]|uniref:Uncharacterized protein n=1 Tax=marine sediment metagenome TaxID=412755 RepID=A0A0F9MKC6_9ZZZZ|nr:MAG: hypothetical protein Lokiarch_05840 [Candidatus Lokiarchaeum sp. GC14_75]
MHEKCVEFVVEFCREICPTWAHCISTSSGFEKGDVGDKKSLLFCLKITERESEGLEVIEEEIEQEISKLNLEV